MELYKLVQNELGLNADAVPGNKPASKSAAQTLRALVTTIQSLAEMRNRLGLGHGRSERSVALTRHARLTLNTAVAVAEFLLDTWQDRQASGR